MKSTLLAVATLLLLSTVAVAEDRPWAARPAVRVGETTYSRAIVGRLMIQLFGQGGRAIHVAHLQLKAALQRKKIEITPDQVEARRKEFTEAAKAAGIELADHRRRLRIGRATQDMAIWNIAATQVLAARVGISEREIAAYLALNQGARFVDSVKSPDDPVLAHIGRDRAELLVETLVEELLVHVVAPERNALLDRLATKAIEDRATASVPPTAPAVLDKLIAERRELIRKASAGRVKLEMFLAQQGRSVEQLRSFLDRQEQMRTAILAQRKVSEDQLRAHFSRWEEFFSGKLVRARQIFFRPTAPAGPERWKAALDRAVAVRKQLVEGADFDELVLRHSDDPVTRMKQGNLGFFPRKSAGMPASIAAAAYSLEPGRISQPIETQFGYHLIQVTGVRDGDEVDFGAVRDRVRRDFADSRALAWITEQKQVLPIETLWDDLRIKEGDRK